MVVDMQEAFRDPIGNFPSIASRTATVVSGFGLLGVPIIVTEQYPKGLGPTAEEIRFSLPEGYEPIEKSTFSAFSAEGIKARLDELKPQNVVLCGIETHVCVNQTALELVEAGYRVHLLTDCVGSRFEHDKQAGLSRMSAAGVLSSSAEMALFELMRDSRHEKFKDVQTLIK